MLAALLVGSAPFLAFPPALVLPGWGLLTYLVLLYAVGYACLRRYATGTGQA